MSEGNTVLGTVQLKDIVATSSKSKAVERAADMEGKLVGTRPHERVVYRSFEKVEKELKELNALLTPESAIGPPPTKKRATKPKELPKKTEKRMTQSTHPKRVRRK